MKRDEQPASGGKGANNSAMNKDEQARHEIDEASTGQGEPQHLLFPFAPSKQAKHLNPIVLAYMGDAIYEAAIRQYLISKPNHRPNHLHREVISYVSAKAQARFLGSIASFLTEEEADVVRQGRNTKSSVPKSADVSEYRQATALEALFGYLYFSGQHDRMRQLVNMIVHVHEAEHDNK
ncbi:Mini-ribonuclease 3 [Paenibacillus sp. OSY-SE]|uniref:Mini-ribonuclease 3 n=1 Tax=Paenibacillus sp. OSY-SE TaxID=1196323 RepID=UPI00030513E8|nr:ribonuclease III domain-containing protein [Paenibacillus sp. OSY-SE]